MQLIGIILPQERLLEPLLTEFSKNNISGATVIDCRGMGEILLHSKKKEEIPFYEFLSELLDQGQNAGKLVIMLLSREKTESVRNIVNDVTGGLAGPNKGVMFGIDLSFTEGIRE